jgi:ABC-2 type transport system permease protein
VTGAAASRRPGPWWRLVAKVWGIAWITLQARLSYLAELLIRSSFVVLVLFVFSQLWRATSGSIDVRAATGLGVAQLIWYLAFTEAMALSASLPNEEVDREVRSGDIAYRLARPVPYPAFHLGAHLGERILRFGIGLLLGVVVAVAVVGPVKLHPASVIAALAAALLGFCAEWVWWFTISLLAFWFEDTTGLQLLYRRAVMLLGGMLVPLEAYPDWLAAVARALPFRFLMYGPARLFVASSAEGAGVLLLSQLGYGLAGLVPLTLVYRFGLRRVSAQGG